MRCWTTARAAEIRTRGNARYALATRAECRLAARLVSKPACRATFFPWVASEVQSCNRAIQGTLAAPGRVGHNGEHCGDQGQARVPGLGAPDLCRPEGGFGALGRGVF